MKCGNLKNILALMAGICVAAPMARAQDGAADLAAIVKTCEACHGPGGNSASASIPRLNGQPADYLTARFISFSDPSRQIPHATNNMWPVTSQVADKMIPALANYFAAQPPTAPQAGAALAAEGKLVYEKGAPNVSSCQSCHGAQGEGQGAVPRLAGQHGEYLKTQLLALYYQSRVSGAMHPSIKFMSREQIDAVAAYLANG